MTNHEQWMLEQENKNLKQYIKALELKLRGGCKHDFKHVDIDCSGESYCAYHKEYDKNGTLIIVGKTMRDVYDIYRCPLCGETKRVLRQ